MSDREREDRTRFEEEGIPDLQDGTPEQQAANDPQEAPPAGLEEPIAAEEHGTTVYEQVRGESLDQRLSRERADVAADPQQAEEEAVGPAPEEEGELPPDDAGRLVEQDAGTRTDQEKEATAADMGLDGAGFEPEERAVYTEPEGSPEEP